jgi:3'-phosphoadenosine 5'-phosphosulfate (PAPS) 3'-phosphatase
MIQVNIQGMKELFTNIGRQLLEKSKEQSKVLSREEMKREIIANNTWAEMHIQQALTAQYPNIAWSPSELNIENQQRPEYEGAYWILDAVDGQFIGIRSLFSGQPPFV